MINAFDEFLAISRKLERRQIRYALIGGVALAYHDQPRFTEDIDLLIFPEDIEAVYASLEESGYFESAQPWTFTTTGITLRRFCRVEGPDHLLVDVMSGSEPRHREIVEQALVAATAEGVVRFARREDLIWLKRQRNSGQDQLDIEGLSK